MACPVCDHTMVKIDKNTFYCERCGSMKNIIYDKGGMAQNNYLSPRLVKRSMDFFKYLEKEISETTLISPKIIMDKARQLSVLESIGFDEAGKRKSPNQ